MEGVPEVLRHDYCSSLQAALGVPEVQQQLALAGLATQLELAPRQERYLEVQGRLADGNRYRGQYWRS